MELQGARPQGKDGRRHQVKESVLHLRAKEERPDLTGSAGRNLQIFSPGLFLCISAFLQVNLSINF